MFAAKAYWAVHGDPNKIESLQDGRRTREYRKATPASIEKLLETVEKEPTDFGYEFGRWTGERLATYLSERTGIKLTGSQIRKILKKKKYVYLAGVVQPGGQAKSQHSERI